MTNRHCIHSDRNAAIGSPKTLAPLVNPGPPPKSTVPRKDPVTVAGSVY
jgi:hypothetical protein